MTLITIMCYEGNYIDGLMSRRESILQLLTAKYYFNVTLLLIPPIILLPLMIIGKMSVWMNIGYFFFTAGVLSYSTLSSSRWQSITTTHFP